jgi:hypothetical protein
MLSLPSPTSVMIDVVVSADGIEPGSEVGATVASVQHSERPEENLLRQILRSFISARELVGDAENSAAETLDDLLPGLLLAEAFVHTAPDKLAIVRLHSLYPDGCESVWSACFGRQD